jgi:DNA (cytosine-5)-methyltransferase 1
MVRFNRTFKTKKYIRMKKVTKNMKKRGLRTLDLFAGIGGIRLAFENNGFTTVYANDNNKHCKETYDLNFVEPKLTVKDVWKIYVKEEIPDFDVLLAGFPCQAFSIAGNRIGFKDEKTGGNLFFKIAQILRIKKPQAFMLENVKNLKNHHKGNTFKVIKNTLEGMGYHIKSEVLNSMTHGNLPQNRERIFIVGFLDKKKASAFEFPNEIPLAKNFKDFTSHETEDKYYYYLEGNSEYNKKKNKPLYQKIKEDVNSEDTVYQWRRRYVRANKKGVVPTLIDCIF